MKKLLLLVLIFFSFSVNSQTILSPPLYSCDGNNDGIAVFDLTSAIPTLLSNFNPQENTFSFHETVNDAHIGTNGIISPNAYTNIQPFSQFIFVRVANINQVNIAIIELAADSVNAGINGVTTVCETSNTPINLTDLITGEQQGGTWTRTSGTGGTFNAQIGIFTAAIGTTPSTFTYTITPNAPCLSASSVATVNVVPQPNAGIDGNLTICDTSTTLVNLFDLIIGEQPGGTWSRVAGTGGTFNAATGIYTPSIGATTSIFMYTIIGTAPCINETSLVTIVINNCNPQNCLPPSGISIDSMTDTSVHIDWDTQSGATSFKISVVPTGTPPSETNVITISASNYTLMNLQPQACYSIYIKAVCSPSESSDWSSPLNICMPDCTNTGDCSQGLALTAFLDSNNNGIKDNGEGNFNYGSFVYQVNDSGTNQYGNSNSGSYYIFDRNPANSYDIAFAVNNNLSPYYSSSTMHNDITIPNGNGFNNLYFPVVNTEPYSDAAVYIHPITQPRPGFTYLIMLKYQNLGLQTIANGTLTFTKDPNVTITFNSEAGVTNTSNGFTFDFTNLASFETRVISLNLSVPTIPTVNLGDLISSNVSVEINDDFNLTNNSATLAQVVVGSYDPNDKSEAHGGKIGLDHFTANDYLYYTIRFENTGTATTEFIKVTDDLDTQLDAASFEMINASHPVNTLLKDHQLTWHFYDAQVPPTSIDPLNSHGYIHFKIKPKAGFAAGDIIPNRASIYFDYNPPIVTDAFETYFFETLANATFNANTVSMTPNPANSIITIFNSNVIERISKVAIYEVTGKRIFNLDSTRMENIIIDISQFSKGMYLVELISDSSSKVIKKLVIQ